MGEIDNDFIKYYGYGAYDLYAKMNRNLNTEALDLIYKLIEENKLLLASEFDMALLDSAILNKTLAKEDIEKALNILSERLKVSEF